MKDAPGIRWAIFLGITGFLAGFIGPMIFVPDANQGPMVGIFISGPIGIVLGLMLYGLSSVLKLSSQLQWRLLKLVAATGVIATLLLVQPEPSLEGTLLEAKVSSCSMPIDVEADTIKYWEQRIAKVNWAQARSGWQHDMHTALQNAPGIILQLTILRENAVYRNRKPWNRDSLFIRGWRDTYEKKTFYRPDGSCSQFPDGLQLAGFQRYNLNGKIAAPTSWPPIELENFIDASMLSDVPDTMKPFMH